MPVTRLHNVVSKLLRNSSYELYNSRPGLCWPLKLLINNNNNNKDYILIIINNYSHCLLSIDISSVHDVLGGGLLESLSSSTSCRAYIPYNVTLFLQDGIT